MPETAVREKPILFSSPMVQAILDGRKTQTRRIIKPQPPSHIDVLHGHDLRGRAPYDLEHSETGGVIGYGFHDDSDVLYKFPYGPVGSRLWVRERWRVASINHSIPVAQFYTIQFANFGVLPHPQPEQSLFAPLAASEAWAMGETGTGFGKWRPSIHMPRWASRITLEITDIRVQRLQEISEEDAIAEGIQIGQGLCGENVYWDYGDNESRSPLKFGAVDSFYTLWESINGEGSWDLNPWLWALTFKVLK